MSQQISLCIVARNEALLLGDAIASAQPVVDEVVVVDTGSTDATVAIARAAGARVVEADWPGDLGSAHALPVAHAQGDWVLALDADEVLDPASRHLVRDLVAHERFDGYEVPVRNYEYRWPAFKWRAADARDPLTRGASGYVPTTPVRLFRRRREYTYVGRVHQTVKPAILASGGRIGLAEVPIHHYGFLRTDRQKSGLYLRLARLHAAEYPEDPGAWIDLGMATEALPAAADAFRRARSLGDRADASFELGCTLLELGQATDSIGLLFESIQNNPDDAAYFYDRADAWEALGEAYEDTGAARDAEGAYRAALRLRPESPAAAINLAGHLIDRGELDEAERIVDLLLTRHRGSALVWSTLGTLRVRRGDLEGGRRALETALDIRPENLAALANLALLHVRSRQPGKAAKLYSAVGERLGSEEAHRLQLMSHIPARYRRQPERPAGRGGIVSMISALGGGGGRALVDAALALGERPHHVLCGQPEEQTGQGLRDELERAGIDVLTVSSEAEIAVVLRQLRPSIVIHHWWWSGRCSRIGREKWICVSHSPISMPLGYDRYVVVSRFQRGLQTHLPPELISCIPNGIDLDRFVEPRWGSAAGPVTIAMTSRLAPDKFPRRLLAYLPSLDDARVLIAGYGARRHELEPEIEALGIQDRVRFVGPLASDAVPGFLAQADIGLHLNEMHVESCPLTVLEMMAAGLPVVAQPRGGLPELVVPGRNGFLEMGEAEIAARLGELVGSADLRARMGRESRRMARSFNMSRFRSSMQALVADVEHERPATTAADGPRRERVRARAAAPWSPRLSYIVCATPQSGGNLLCEALRSTGLAGDPDEHLRVVTAGLPPGLDLGTYLGDIVEETATPNGVFGITLMPDQLSVLLERLGPVPGSVFPNLRCVRIRRRDRLRQAISLERALQTGLWETSGDPLPIELPQPRFNRAAIDRRMREIELGEAQWEEYLAAAGAEPVEVLYEELVDGYERTARRVLGELAIEVPPNFVLAPGELVRQADALTEAWAKRWATADVVEHAPVTG